MTDENDRRPTERFSGRVADYVRYRPGYPDALLETLVEATGLGPGRVVADVGSGTGISTELLLRSGARVLAVEPNPEMRLAAEERLGGEPRFRSVAGTAEATTLPDASVDLVTAGQAFHWFDPERTRREWLRILRGRPEERGADRPASREPGGPGPAGGWVALFWNARQTDTTPFLRDYEALLHRFGTDYHAVDHTRLGPERFESFFRGSYTGHTFPNRQVLDFERLRGRLLSSSYTPAPGHPDHEPMLAELRRLFDRHQDGGHVQILYDTQLHLGRFRGRLEGHRGEG
ncbi:MAG: class I SAM-dependent methyltransferase [Thermoanaerobaculia bacterium]